MAKKFVNKNGEEIERQPCEIFTRVMGYYRPVSQFNTGKKAEFYSRTFFKEDKSMNSDFIKQYQNAEDKTQTKSTKEEKVT